MTARRKKGCKYGHEPKHLRLYGEMTIPMCLECQRQRGRGELLENQVISDKDGMRHAKFMFNRGWP